MSLYSAGAVLMESGHVYSSVMAPVNRVTRIRVDTTLPRVNVTNLYRGKPLEARPLQNYAPINVTMDLYKSDNSLEYMLGLANPTGVTAYIADSNPLTTAYGIRNMQVYYAPETPTNYNGLLDIKSGVVMNYSLQGTVTEPVSQSVSMQFLDMSGSYNAASRQYGNYVTSLIKPENISLTGIQFAGYGVSGFTIQSFSLTVNFNRTPVTYMGQKLPQNRPMTDALATLQVQGYLEGLNNTLTGLQAYAGGTPTYGTVSLVLIPGCPVNDPPNAVSPTIITMTNPYLDAIAIEGQPGNMTTLGLTFTLPIGPNAAETQDGSTLVIQ